jgi:hypothetical protein
LCGAEDITLDVFCEEQFVVPAKVEVVGAAEFSFDRFTDVNFGTGCWWVVVEAWLVSWRFKGSLDVLLRT